jgi:hypothetical protein
MRPCRLCGKTFDPGTLPTTPAEEAGAILAREQYDDAGELCLGCLDSRGRLAMMYLTEFHG